MENRIQVGVNEIESPIVREWAQFQMSEPAREHPSPQEAIHDRKCLISGGTTGIGRATAILLAKLGAHVLVFGRKESALLDAKKSFEEHGVKVYGMLADQAVQADVERVFREVDESLGGLDFLINNAAIAGSSVIEDPDWRYVVASNFDGYLACTREAIKRMEAQGGGRIVNIGSVSASERGPGDDVYAATKAAIQAFTDSLAKRVAKRGISVSVIEPGRVGTDMTLDRYSPEEQRDMQEQLRMMKAEDIAECILFCLRQPPRVRISRLEVRELIMDTD